MAAVMLRCLQPNIDEERYSDKGVPTVTSDEQVGIFVCKMNSSPNLFKWVCVTQCMCLKCENDYSESVAYQMVNRLGANIQESSYY